MDTEQTVQRLHIVENHVRTLANMSAGGDVPDNVIKPFRQWLADELHALADDVTAAEPSK